MMRRTFSTPITTGGVPNFAISFLTRFCGGRKGKTFESTLIELAMDDSKVKLVGTFLAEQSYHWYVR